MPSSGSESEVGCFGNKCRSRTVLSVDQVREIFALKEKIQSGSYHCTSVRIATKYNVSSKAIRDIWNGRSWLDATYDMWSTVDRPERKIVGRPKGKKDSKPRAKSVESSEKPTEPTPAPMTFKELDVKGIIKIEYDNILANIAANCDYFSSLCSQGSNYFGQQPTAMQALPSFRALMQTTFNPAPLMPLYSQSPMHIAPRSRCGCDSSSYEVPL
eukprot:CAMPEP_0113670598 /NCGR_PEP_ID=MMETSP0038_2-20120614/5230_1 /TAXON_ID=2898 /ORGANISM="Cryptomonas paramecium" /LENGTH=213 /DNA_ID=CAMNT_0000586641 /DNA_START=9 /DNA_END=650 /DNA_ORIENTATION=- /assembly_acc=CAM_ASM_000170